MSAQKATRKKDAKAGAVVSERFYDIITRPVITEKATQLAEQNKVVFKVRRDAQKTEVKQAVEALFGVKVLKVNTVNLHGKSKLFKGRAGIRQDVKKAIVTLVEGQSIDFAAGVK